MESIPELFLKYANRHREKTAVYDKSERYSYSELAEQFMDFSRFLRERYPEDTRIGIVMQNSVQFIIAFYGILLGGHIAVPIDIDIHMDNLKYIAGDCSIKALVFNKKISGDFYSDQAFDEIDLLLFNPTETTFKKRTVFNLTEILTGLHRQFEPTEIYENDIASILYTTGTTGLKKGVKITHRNLLAATENIVNFMEMNDSVIESLPMRLSHSFGLGRCRSVFLAGGTVVVENGFRNTGQLIENIKTFRVNALSSVPSGFSLLLNYFSDAFKEISHQIRFIEIGSAPMPVDQKIKLMEYCPNAKICMHYGLTEASRATFLDFRKDTEFLHTIGKPSPNVNIKLVNEKKERIDFGFTGEIAISGDIVSPGYWGDNSLTDQTFINGWLYTGDLGQNNEKGYIEYKGRISDIINKGGLKIAPLEVEKVLYMIPEVSEVAVCGCPTDFPIPGTKIKAFLVMDRSSNPPDIDKIKKFCFTHLEEYKVPDEFEFFDELPKIGSGKIDRKQLLKNCI